MPQSFNATQRRSYCVNASIGQGDLHRQNTRTGPFGAIQRRLFAMATPRTQKLNAATDRAPRNAPAKHLCATGAFRRVPSRLNVRHADDQLMHRRTASHRSRAPAGRNICAVVRFVARQPATRGDTRLPPPAKPPQRRCRTSDPDPTPPPIGQHHRARPTISAPLQRVVQLRHGRCQRPPEARSQPLRSRDNLPQFSAPNRYPAGLICSTITHGAVPPRAASQAASAWRCAVSASGRPLIATADATGTPSRIKPSSGDTANPA